MSTAIWNRCKQCDTEMVGSAITKKFCSIRCKAAWRKKNAPPVGSITSHACRECGTDFPLQKGKYHQFICSVACRKTRLARSVREHHERRPQAEARNRARAKEKRLPNSNIVRFRRVNPDAPLACESCGESRVLDVAHKPGHERMGRGRRADLMRWPLQVWVLCPTCHALHDRMNYSAAELGLKV